MKNKLVISIMFCMLIPGYAFAADLFNGHWKGTYSAYVATQGCKYSVDINIKKDKININEQRVSCTWAACSSCLTKYVFTNDIARVTDNTATFSMVKSQLDTNIKVSVDKNTINGEGKTKSHGYKAKYNFNAYKVLVITKN